MPKLAPGSLRIDSAGRVRGGTWGAALARFEPEPPVLQEPKKGPPRTRKSSHPRPKRYLRPNRPRYDPRNRPPGWVEFSVRPLIPELLNTRLRQLAKLDDRPIAELVVLGLSWLVTEWAAKRIPPTVEWDLVVPYYNKYPKTRRK